MDGKYGFSLELGEILTEKLKIGIEIDQARLKTLKKLSSDGKLRMRTMAWLLNRPHSTRELRDYLVRKKIDEALITKLTKEFTDKAYLNDEKYALWLAGLRSRAGRSNRAIRSELFSKGIDREVADRVLEESDELGRLKDLAAKKRRLARYKNDELKLKQYLVRQGFSYDQVREVLEF